MDTHRSTDHPQLRPTVDLSGTATAGFGPPIGLLDIGIGEDAYFFRVALPGLRKNESNLKCEIKRDGTVNIQGVITPDGGILKNSSSVFQMKTQQLCPPGQFSISFKLPGPVDPRLFSPCFRPDGILEVVVMQWKPRRA